MKEKSYYCDRCHKQHVILFQQAAPFAPDPWWYTVGQVLFDLAVLLVLVLVIPFILWLVWS